jgi:anti-sigma-K factor RskA
MAPHEEFLQLSAAATAGELTSDEQLRLDAHLESCTECRRIMHEYAIASQHGAAALASEFATEGAESDGSWSVEEAEKAFFRRLVEEDKSPRPAGGRRRETAERGQRFKYRPSQVHWREIWMSLAAVVFLALAFAITAYRTGMKRGTGNARMTNQTVKESASLEEQVSDLGHERAQLLTKLADDDRTIAGLKRQLSAQEKVVTSLKTRFDVSGHSTNGQQLAHAPSEAGGQRDQELVAAQAKLLKLQKTIETLAGQRNDVKSRAATLEAKVGELTQLVRDTEYELEQKKDQLAKDQDLLDHDRDIRELVGARDLYIAEIHDVSGNGATNKTYGRIFYSRGKRLVFYAYDLDAQHGVQEASSFQAWGRRGPDKQQALNLGVLYEDNVSKKRWVLKADDPKSLEDIDAVFVTLEPNGGSQHPSGKQLLFAYLRVSPNHP